jgi:hypothetical protein
MFFNNYCLTKKVDYESGKKEWEQIPGTFPDVR